VNGPVKSLFRRHRPPWEQERPLRLRRPRTSSFPSGHASAAMTAAGVLSQNDPLWPLYYALGAVVASSRVYVKIHHPSDVVAGALVGIALARVARRVWPFPDVPGAAGPGE
jgi:membrane-associated phospholipid phosphatase